MIVPGPTAKPPTSRRHRRQRLDTPGRAANPETAMAIESNDAASPCDSSAPRRGQLREGRR